MASFLILELVSKFYFRYLFHNSETPGPGTYLLPSDFGNIIAEAWQGDCMASKMS